jgi:hypothetical protein
MRLVQRPRLLKMVGALGRAFVRRGMHAHAAKLRAYYVLLRRGLATPGKNEVDIRWSEALVIEWMKILRMPPYENAYPVRPAQSSCSRCRETPTNEAGGFQTESTFPGGWKVRCSTCGEAWLVLEGKSDR